MSSTNIPFVPGDITKEKVEACLQKSGKPADTKIKSIDVKRTGLEKELYRWYFYVQ